jgi:hypothetical protein
VPDAKADIDEGKVGGDKAAVQTDDKGKEPNQSQGEDADDETGDDAENDGKQDFGGNMAFNGQGGQFPNMNFAGSGDFNQMQMMMAMQNGMQPNAFGGFPLMGTSFRRFFSLDIC